MGFIFRSESRKTKSDFDAIVKFIFCEYGRSIDLSDITDNRRNKNNTLRGYHVKINGCLNLVASDRKAGAFDLLVVTVDDDNLVRVIQKITGVI